MVSLGNGWVMAVDEEDGGDILAACGLQDKLIKVPQIERASAGLGRPLLLTTLPPKSKESWRFPSLGPNPSQGGPC